MGNNESINQENFRGMKTEQLIKDRGYPIEIHSVTTEDGYILTLYRIKHGKNDPTTESVRSRPPALLIHGMMSSCADWVNEEYGLAYFLADRGFDVWMGNCRGTTYSSKHISFDCKKDRKKYWNFSWHEIGYYDVAAFIDFVLETTKYSKIFYVGFSQGTTTIMALLSTRVEYNLKICLCILMGASAIYEHSKLQPIPEYFMNIVTRSMLCLFGPSEIPLLETGRKIGERLSRPGSCGKIIHEFLVHKLLTKTEQMRGIDLHRLSETSPNPSSIQQAIHYNQIIKGRCFRMYDHGSPRNKELYGSELPPEYDLKKMTVPVALFIGKDDIYCDPRDGETLSKMLGNVIHKHVIPREDFGHLDFVYANDATTLVYHPVLEIMEQYHPDTYM